MSDPMVPVVWKRGHSELEGTLHDSPWPVVVS